MNIFGTDVTPTLEEMHMLLGLFVHAALAGGPGAWDPVVHATDTSLPPITVHVMDGLSGYTRVELTNNLTGDLYVDLRTTSTDVTGRVAFLVQKELADATCAYAGTPDYTHCPLTLPAGDQLDIVLTYTPSATMDVLGELTVSAWIIDANGVTPWSYALEKLLIAKAE